jgi:hypothetical protein
VYDLASVERGRNTSTSPLYDSATTADTSTGSTENHDHNLAVAEPTESNNTNRVSRKYIIMLVLCVSALVVLFGILTTVILMFTIKSGMLTARILLYNYTYENYSKASNSCNSLLNCILVCHVC